MDGVDLPEFRPLELRPSPDIDDPGVARDIPPLPLARWTALVGLYSTEAVLFCLLFGPGIRENGPWLWDNLAYRLVYAAPPTVLAALLFGGAWLREGRRTTARHPLHPLQLWHFLLAHWAALAGFILLTALVQNRMIRSSAHPGRWLWGWLVMGLATLLLGVASLLPARFQALVREVKKGRVMAAVAVGVIASGAAHLMQRTWEPLSQPTLWLVHALLALVFPDAVCDPANCAVGTASFTVSVDWPCAGYEGIGLILEFLSAYLWFSRRDLRFPRAFLLLPIGTALIWLANAFRIAALVALGVWISPDVTLGGFHSLAGWLIFNGIALGIVIASRRMRFFSRPHLLVDGTEYTNPTPAYLVPLLAIIATTMITGAFSSGFDTLYPLRVLTAAGALWYFRRDHARWGWTWSWPAVAIGAVAFVLWMALEPTPASQGALATGLAGLPPTWATTWLVFRVVGAVVTVPLAEELAFRGYLTRRLIAADFQDVPLGRFTWSSFLLSSAAFGALHGRWLAGTLAGMLYALALYRRGAIADAVTAHATTNALIAAYVLATGSWSLWA